MKPNRDAAALAASLTNAASAPLQLPERPASEAKKDTAERPRKAAVEKPKKTEKTKVVTETVGITLRPAAELLNRYCMAAAERTMKEGRVISAQQIMLEILEREMRGKP